MLQRGAVGEEEGNIQVLQHLHSLLLQKENPISHRHRNIQILQDCPQRILPRKILEKQLDSRVGQARQ